MQIQFKEKKEEQQVVVGEVFSPGIIDSQNDFMNAEEIEKMAWDFLRKGRVGQIDVSHDNKLYGCYVVESFIARKDDTMFIPGAWVMAVHVPDEELWGMIKEQKLNGFSMEVHSFRKEVEVEMELPLVLEGTTLKIDSGHQHKYTVFIDEDGNFRGGKTDVVDGHYHEIKAGTVTELANEHRHKFSFPDVIVELEKQIDVQTEAED